MSSGISDAIGALTKRVADALEQIITIRVQFEELRRYTRETIDKYKRLLKRATDRIDRVERERVAKEAELHAMIAGLSARLDALSEGALHAAIQRMAPELLMTQLEEERCIGRSAAVPDADWRRGSLGRPGGLSGIGPDSVGPTP